MGQSFTTSSLTTTQGLIDSLHHLYPMSDAIQLVALDGNIGSGKSTLLALLQKRYENKENTIILQEPVNVWDEMRDKDGVSILSHFYQNKEKYSFPFQMLAFITRLNIMNQAVMKAREIFHLTKKRVYIITERSLYTDKEIFAKMLYDSGMIEDINYKIYLKWFDEFAISFKCKKQIYLRTFPITCKERIQIRSRTGESDIQSDYLYECDRYHTDYINMLAANDVNILKLDGNIDIKNTNLVNEMMNKIDGFIYYE